MRRLKRETGPIAVDCGHLVYSGTSILYIICAYMSLTGTANTRAIPFYNVLWAELKDSELTLHYASPASKTVVRAATLKYPVEYQMVELVNKWIYKLLDRSYGESQRRKRAKV